MLMKQMQSALKSVLSLLVVSLALVMAPGCDEGETDEFRSSTDDENYICWAEVDERGTVVGVYCPGEVGGEQPVGGSCYGELLCCDKVTLGCFCANTEHGAVCPHGSVAAPSPDDDE